MGQTSSSRAAVVLKHTTDQTEAKDEVVFRWDPETPQQQPRSIAVDAAAASGAASEAALASSRAPSYTWGRAETLTGAAASTARETDPLMESPKEKSLGFMEAFTDGFGMCSFFRTVQLNFGFKLMWLLFFTQHLLKGFAIQLSADALPYLFRSYNVPAPQVQIYSGISQLPWSLKPIIGLLSDILPINGYNKAPYMLLTSLLGTLAVLYVAVLPHHVVSVIGIVVAYFFFSLQGSTCDLLSEAKYAEKMQENPTHGPALLTYVWLGLSAAAVAAVLITGPVLSSSGPKVVMMICVVPCVLVVVPVFKGYLEEHQVSAYELGKMRARFYEQKEACFLCVLMLIGCIIIFVVGIVYEDPGVNCAVAIGVAAVMLIAFSVVLSPVIAKFNAFSLIQTAISVSTSGAAFYFYTDTDVMYPEGPHFSPFFFNTVMGLVGQLTSMIGIVLYQRYLKTWKYRHLLICTNIVYTILCCLDMLVFARLNRRVGIPDHACVMGFSVFQSIVFQWQWMPQVVILSYLCPKGMEATMYALLAGCHNLGNTIAANAGALMLRQLGVQPQGLAGESAQFQNLWKASAISAALPFIAIMVLYRLVPDAYQNERLVEDSEHDATTGSLWKRWMGPAADPGRDV